jgi:hypothetical protein
LSEEHQQVLLNLFFFKFDFVARPTQELQDLEEQHRIDPWFEFMKRLQQYPEEDSSHLKGSFILDWTKILDLAIYFANESREGEGALWIADVTATGKTLQKIKVSEILAKMANVGSRNAPLGIPLTFYPDKQLNQKRAKNQDPVYIAQMDLRADLSEVWDNLVIPIKSSTKETGQREPFTGDFLAWLVISRSRSVSSSQVSEQISRSALRCFSALFRSPFMR